MVYGVVAIRNIAVAQGVVTAGNNSLAYVVPDGHAFIFKSLRSNRLPALADQSLSVYLGSGSGGFNDFTAFFDLIDGGGVDWATWFVMNAGNAVYLYAPVSDIAYWISGAVLPFAPGFTPTRLPASSWPPTLPPPPRPTW